jgi:metal-dependent amidase/aminoacylase/carboxypeptidase family protein
VHGGSINNIVPNQIELQGTARFFDPALSDHVEAQIRKIAGGMAQSHGLSYALDYRKGYPAVINTERGVAAVRRAVSTFLPEDKIITNQKPTLGCEDFAFMLNAVGEGAHIWLGAGEVGPRGGLHGDRFVFNDNLFPLGLRVWTSLAGTLLPKSA